ACFEAIHVGSSRWMRPPTLETGGRRQVKIGSMSVEVRILGPVEVLVDGVPASLGGRTQRALLALLALQAGELVTRARLYEELWPDADPANAARNVTSYVFALRKALGPAGDLVQTRPGGYLLDVTPEQLDAARFERLAQEGKRALAEGRH